MPRAEKRGPADEGRGPSRDRRVPGRSPVNHPGPHPSAPGSFLGPHPSALGPFSGPRPSSLGPVQHKTADISGTRIHYVEAGAGPLVVLLHGFPEFWYSWRKQIPALAAAGFRGIAPDLRGENQSSTPEGGAAVHPPHI